MLRPIEADKRPPLVHRHHPGLMPQPLLRDVAFLDLKLVGPTGVCEHPAPHSRGRPASRRRDERLGHHAGKEQDVIDEVKHAFGNRGQVGRGLAGRERPQREPLKPAGAASLLVHMRPYHGEVHLPCGVGSRDDSFDDHEALG